MSEYRFLETEIDRHCENENETYCARTLPVVTVLLLRTLLHCCGTDELQLRALQSAIDLSCQLTITFCN